MEEIIIRNAIVDDILQINDFEYFPVIVNCLKIKQLYPTTFVAESNGKVIGLLISEKSLLKNFDIKIIEVLPDYRKQGIGSMLINKLREITNKKPITVYYPNKLEVQNFYKSNGFDIGDNIRTAILIE
jgi:Acetyltransferases